MTKPILAGKTAYAGELPLIVADDRTAEHHRLSGNQQIVAPDRCAGPFKPSADQAVRDISGRLEGQNVECAKYRFKLSRESW